MYFQRVKTGMEQSNSYIVALLSTSYFVVVPIPMSLLTVHTSLLRSSSSSSPRWYHLQSLSADVFLVSPLYVSKPPQSCFPAPLCETGVVWTRKEARPRIRRKNNSGDGTKFRKDRTGRRGGGLLLYIRETIPAYEVQLQEK